MKREDVHLCWTREGDPWSAWVKPVLFASMAEKVKPLATVEAPGWLYRDIVEPLIGIEAEALGAPQPAYRGSSLVRDTALVLDLPGADAVTVGAGLIDYGFRPVPLYNALDSDAAIVEVRSIMDALVDNAARLANVRAGAPPAFLLDAKRMSGSVRPGYFDNRSVCRESDFPPPDTLLQVGIRRAVLIQATDERPAFDLEPILFAWQNRGLELWRKATNHPTPATRFILRRRPWWTRIVGSARRAFLRRGRDGAYGMFIPVPSAG